MLMLIYSVALPVWNFVLPVYAFWHVDDFSWGETRKTVGDVKGESNGDVEGKFDHSTIAMKRWNEWQKERRQTLRSIGNLNHVIQSVFK
jgi:chitin synthase